jgi:hypothetical protein
MQGSRDSLSDRKCRRKNSWGELNVNIFHGYNFAVHEVIQHSLCSELSMALIAMTAVTVFPNAHGPLEIGTATECIYIIALLVVCYMVSHVV